jgi:serine protease DegS
VNHATSTLKRSFWPILSGLLAAVLVIILLGRNFDESDRSSNKLSQENTQSTASWQKKLHPQSFSQAVERSAPAVTNIYTRKTVVRHSHPLFNDPLARKFFGLKQIPKEEVQRGLGSGVIMKPEGYILTNHHVIQGADEILVELKDKRRSKAQLIGVDEETDLAVLKINLEHLPYMEESNEAVAVGDIALAIGNPLGIGQTVTMGIVSATGRSNLGLNTYENFIQTDASINKGNSGGALVDSQGKLIGINSVIFSKSGGSDGIGFAIPAALAQEVMENIIKNGRVIRGWLGATFQKLSPELANYLGTQLNHGVVIIRILKEGPAHRAGVMPGDLITKIDGAKIVSEQDALAAIAKVKPGQSSELSIIRKGKEMTLKATVGERPKQ